MKRFSLHQAAGDYEVLVVADSQALAREAAVRFRDLAREAVDNRGRFSVALSGGSTPRDLYRLLNEEPYRDDIPWHDIHFFWGDERCVAPDHPESNYRLAQEALLGRLSLPDGNVHRVRGELPPESAARSYEKELESYFCGPLPRLDLVLLGLGSDGHIASLFPASPALDEIDRSAVAVQGRYQNRPAWRVTLTLPAINAARQVLFLVSGPAKAEAVAAALGEGSDALPARRVHPQAGAITWLIDAPAAQNLPTEQP